MSTTSKKPLIDPKSKEETEALKKTVDLYRENDEYKRSLGEYKNQILDQLDMIPESTQERIQKRQEQEEENRKVLIKDILSKMPELSEQKLNELPYVDVQYYFDRLNANDSEYLYKNLSDEQVVKQDSKEVVVNKPATNESKKSWFAKLIEFFIT